MSQVIRFFRDNLVARIAEARREGRLGEVEGLQVGLAGAEEKLAQLDRRPAGHATVDLGFPAPPCASTSNARRQVDRRPLLLEHGGVATDDYSAHPWTLQEIKSGAVNDGLRFFDFRTYHAPD
ncbi:hypothetical protein [Streptomyces sp. NPDC001165]|uniref:hypothetical protein n=1 Tax=Streptomyces sp. NPDC001165 TaxID=3364546 RepID=UPI003675644A